MSTRAAYTGDGSTTVFNIDIPFDDPATIFAEVDEALVTFSWTGPSQITLDVAPAPGSAIYIYRKTDVSAPEVVFQDAQVLIAGDLNDAIDQVLDSDQEQWDDINDLRQSSVRGPRGTVMASLPAPSERAGRYLAFDASGNPIAATPASSDGGAVPPDLLSDTGAGLVGTADGSSVQAHLDSLNGSVEVNTKKLATEDFSSTPSAGMSGIQLDKTFAGRSAGDSDYRVLLSSGKFSGAYGGFQLNVYHGQAEARHTAGTLSFLRAMEGYSRLGLQGSATGNVASARVFEGHVANESAASSIASAVVFHSGDTDYGDDIVGAAGTIGTVTGLFVGNLSHATKLTGAAYGVFVGNMTTPAGGVTVAAYATEMAGPGKWTLLGKGSSPSALAGALRVGDNTVPTDMLEVKGSLKVSDTGEKTTTGSYHEINSGNNDFILHLKNRHVTAPSGVRIRFTGAAPNNTVQQFLMCEDSVTTRIVIWSNGNIVNSNNSYGAISDRRLKTDIRDASPQLDDVRALKVRNYRLKADGPDGPVLLGLVAQEAEEVSPGLVFESEGGMKGVNYSVLYMKAVKALQELAEKVDALEAEVNSLRESR